MQVIALQQEGQAIKPMCTALHAKREAKYKAVIADLLILDCTSMTAVGAFLNGLSIQE